MAITWEKHRGAHPLPDYDKYLDGTLMPPKELLYPFLAEAAKRGREYQLFVDDYVPCNPEEGIL